jgi:hypothetical protein
MSQAESSTDDAQVEQPVAAAPQAPASSVAAVQEAGGRGARRAGSPTLIGVAFIAVTLLFFCGVFIGQDFLVERHHNAGLYVEPKYLDFGEVWAVKDFKWRIPIQNISDRPVEIAEFTASCQCSLIEPSSMTIPPHSTAEVVTTIDLTTGRDMEPHESTRDFRIAIHPIVAVPTSSPPGFILRGTAKDVFTPSPRELDVGEILSQTAGKPTTIRLKAATPLASVTALPQPDITIDIKPIDPNQEVEAPAESQVVSSSPPLPASPSPTLAAPTAHRLPPTTEFLLTVTPSDQIPLGKIDRVILLQGIDAEDRKLPFFVVKLTGEIVFDVAVEPRELYAGLIEMDETYETTLTLRSRTGSRFALIPVDQEPGVTLTPLPQGKGEPTPSLPTSDFPGARSAADRFSAQDGLPECAFRLRVKPQSRSEQSTVARFRTINQATGEVADLELPISYYGACRIHIASEHTESTM